MKAGEQVYEDAPSIEKIQKNLNNFLEDYNAENANQMNLVFFKDAILHLLRISRCVFEA